MSGPHNFALSEFLHSDTAEQYRLPNVPTWDQVDNLRRLAMVMEQVRTILGNFSIYISSGYRSPEVNAKVGGVPDSAHGNGLACDFTVPAFGGPHAVALKLQPHMQELGIDQLIWEYDRWVHLGLTTGAPRFMALTIDDNGTRSGFA